jgi:hypothetical protein
MPSPKRFTHAELQAKLAGIRNLEATLDRNVALEVEGQVLAQSQPVARHENYQSIEQYSVAVGPNHSGIGVSIGSAVGGLVAGGLGSIVGAVVGHHVGSPAEIVRSRPVTKSRLTAASEAEFARFRNRAENLKKKWQKHRASIYSKIKAIKAEIKPAEAYLKDLCSPDHPFYDDYLATLTHIIDQEDLHYLESSQPNPLYLHLSFMRVGEQGLIFIVTA